MLRRRCSASGAPAAFPFAAAAGPGDITAADLNNPRFASLGHGYDDIDPKGIVKRATDDHFYGSDDLFDEEPVFDEGPVFDEEPSIEIDSSSFNNSAPFNYSTYCLSDVDVMTSVTFDDGPVFDEEPIVDDGYQLTVHVCCRFMEGKNTEAIENAEGVRTTPSVFAFSQKGEQLVGTPADEIFHMVNKG
jgi:hypothetical protein